MRGGWDSRRLPQPLLNQTSVPSCLRVLRVNRAEPDAFRSRSGDIAHRSPRQKRTLNGISNSPVLRHLPQNPRSFTSPYRVFIVKSTVLPSVRGAASGTALAPASQLGLTPSADMVNTEHAEFRRHGGCFLRAVGIRFALHNRISIKSPCLRASAALRVNRPEVRGAGVPLHIVQSIVACQWGQTPWK